MGHLVWHPGMFGGCGEASVQVGHLGSEGRGEGIGGMARLWAMREDLDVSTGWVGVSGPLTQCQLTRTMSWSTYEGLDLQVAIAHVGSGEGMLVGTPHLCIGCTAR